jgi:hypothetical protein
MKLRVVALYAMVVLAGCAETPKGQAIVTLADTCNSYATALDKLTPLKVQGQLSASEISTVDNINTLTGPLCSSGTVPANPGDAVTFVAGQTAALWGMLHKYGVT